MPIIYPRKQLLCAVKASFPVNWKRDLIFFSYSKPFKDPSLCKIDSYLGKKRMKSYTNIITGCQKAEAPIFFLTFYFILECRRLTIVWWFRVHSRATQPKFSRQEYWSGVPCRGFSWPRDQTQGSCIVGRFVTMWTTGEAHICIHSPTKIFLRFFLKLIFNRWSVVDFNAMLVSATQQSESVIHICISSVFKILFPHKSLWSIE